MLTPHPTLDVADPPRTEGTAAQRGKPPVFEIDAKHVSSVAARGSCDVLRVDIECLLRHLGRPVLIDLANAAEARGMIRNRRRSQTRVDRCRRVTAE